MKRIEPTKEQAQTWANALRSGEYKQTVKQLQDDNGYCCLGVACKLFIPEQKQQFVENTNILFGLTPNNQPNVPEWLRYLNGIFHRKTDQFLTLLNDKEGFTFDEIADIIEMVYVLRVLDDEENVL